MALLPPSTCAVPRTNSLLQLQFSASVSSNHLAIAGFPTGCLNLTRRSRKSILTATLVAPQVGTVTEVKNDTFWPIVKAAPDKIIVVDMYTKWCGPCKIIAPKYEELSTKYDDVLFLKLDCNQDNRPLAKELGIKVVPTFKILKGGSIVKEVTGAKYDELVAAIEAVRSSR